MQSAKAILIAAFFLTTVVLAQTTAPPPGPPPSPGAPPSRPKGMLMLRENGSGSYLGIVAQDITSDRLTPLKLKEESGVEVQTLDQDGPSAKAGIREHDVIVSFNDNKVESLEELRRLLRETPPTRTVTIGLSRDGTLMSLKVQLGTRPRPAGAFHSFGPSFPPMPPMATYDLPSIAVLQYSPSGVVLEDLTQQLGEFFGVHNGEGVLVRTVQKGSPADQAGLRAGDVIVRMEGQRIANTSDWRRMVLARHGSGTVSLGIIRGKREQTISLKMVEPNSGMMLPSSPDFDLATKY